MIHPPDWTIEQSKATLGALRSIATLHGTEQPALEENRLLEGVRINILRHSDIADSDENIHLHPEEVAAVIQDDEHRERAAQLIALMPCALIRTPKLTSPKSSSKRWAKICTESKTLSVPGKSIAETWNTVP